jgi:hypothetical protein
MGEGGRVSGRERGNRARARASGGDIREALHARTAREGREPRPATPRGRQQPRPACRQHVLPPTSTYRRDWALPPLTCARRGQEIGALLLRRTSARRNAERRRPCRPRPVRGEAAAASRPSKYNGRHAGHGVRIRPARVRVPRRDGRGFFFISWARAREEKKIRSLNSETRRRAHTTKTKKKKKNSGAALARPASPRAATWGPPCPARPRPMTVPNRSTASASRPAWWRR